MVMRSVESAVDVWLKSLTLDEAGEVLAAIADALAQQLDRPHDESNPASIAKELRACIDAITDSVADAGELYNEIFGEDA